MEVRRIQGNIPEGLYACFYQKLREISYVRDQEISKQDFLAEVIEKGMKVVEREIKTQKNGKASAATG